MRRQTIITLAALLLVLVVAGCSQTPGEVDTTEGAEPTIEPVDTVGETDPGAISALGQVIPAEKGGMSFTISGIIEEILVEEGDVVEAGDEIARLDTTQLDIAVERAEAALAVAEAKLERASAGPAEAQLAEAESNLQAATASTVVTSGQRDVLTTGPSQSELLAAQAAVQQAYNNLEQQRTQYNWVAGVQTNPDAYTEEQRQTLPYAEADARRQLEAREREYELAQTRLADLQSGPDPNTARALDADVWASSAEYRAAESERDRLLAGPSEEAIQLAEAVVMQAQAALDRAEAARQKAILVAPFDGTVTDVLLRQAQVANAGENVVMLADLSDMMVETTDLSEMDVAQLNPGDTVTVTFDALPDEEITGTVVSIAPRAVEGTGVNFTATIALDSVPERLRWGMTAIVEKQIDPVS